MHMTAEAWIALVALAVTIVTAIVTATTVILNKISSNKEELDQELSAIRLAAYEEYKTLRKEIADIAESSRREFGETIHALREKVTEVELWIRDQLNDTKHHLTDSIEDRYAVAMGKLDKNEERLRQLELFTARVDYSRKDSLK